MSYSSKNQSSRRGYAGINGPGYRTHDNYPKEYRHFDDSFHHMHAPHDSHREYLHHASYGNCGPRHHVTSSRTPTNGDFITSHHQSTTSYHQSTTTYHTPYHGRRGGTIRESHRSSSGYTHLHHQGRPHAPSLDDDEWYFSDRGKHRNGRSNDHREEDASGNNRDDHCYRDREHHQEGPQPREPKPTHRDGYSSKPKNHNNHRYTANNSPGQGKPNHGSSQREKKPHSTRSDNRRKENSGRNPPQDTQSRAKEELPDHYATLRISPLATDEEIKSAAKRRRVEVHPDKLRKEWMSPSELAKIDDAAAKVGFAADLLQNPEQRLEYDRKLSAANH